TVADFAAAWARHAADFADRERREVVMQHEALPGFPFEAFDLLCIVGSAERAGDQRLRFAASEDGGAVGARQYAGFDPDRAHLVELAAVEADAVRQDFLAQDFLFEVLEYVLRVGAARSVVFGVSRKQILLNLIDLAVVIELF